MQPSRWQEMMPALPRTASQSSSPDQKPEEATTRTNGAAQAEPAVNPTPSALASPSTTTAVKAPITNPPAAASALASPASGARPARDLRDAPSAPGVDATPAGPPGASTTKSPIVLASVGTHSGPVGQTLFPVTQGAQMWVRWINDRGGLNGHPVRLLLFDDGNDSARHRAQVQEAVERHRAIAMLANAEGLTGRGSIEYLTSKRIPVIGSEMGSAWFYESPMYFPQGSTDAPLWYGVLGVAAETLLPQGKRQLAVLTCVEAARCRTIKEVVNRYASEAGFEIRYQAEISIAQPDFTAECLSAARSGADALILGSDTNLFPASRVRAPGSRTDRSTGSSRPKPPSSSRMTRTSKGCSQRVRSLPISSPARRRPTSSRTQCASSVKASRRD